MAGLRTAPDPTTGLTAKRNNGLLGKIRGPYKNRIHPLQRVLSRIEMSPQGCWLFLGAQIRGYGSVPNALTSQFANRIVWEYTVGPVPDGLELDHLCRVRHCVNPTHLEPVTHKENLRRGRAFAPNPDTLRRRAQTLCKRGHPLSDPNVYLYQGHRHCLACGRLRKIKARATLKS